MESRRVLSSPLDSSSLRGLRAGDVFYVTGLVLTARDKAHERLVLEKKPLPVDARGLAVMHAGPVVVERGGSLACLSLGPTTSARFENLIPEFVETTGAKLV
ncbi:MAG: fumarate hydratase C-terminal domain-containing protein, partial [Acidilobaceae archaeon]